MFAAPEINPPSLGSSPTITWRQPIQQRRQNVVGQTTHIGGIIIVTQGWGVTMRTPRVKINVLPPMQISRRARPQPAQDGWSKFLEMETTRFRDLVTKLWHWSSTWRWLEIWIIGLFFGAVAMHEYALAIVFALSATFAAISRIIHWNIREFWKGAVILLALLGCGYLMFVVFAEMEDRPLSNTGRYWPLKRLQTRKFIPIFPPDLSGYPSTRVQVEEVIRKEAKRVPPATEPKIRIVTINGSPVSDDNLQLELVYAQKTDETLKMVGSHRFSLFTVPPSPVSSDAGVTPGAINKVLEFRKVEEAAWKVFEDHEPAIDHRVFFDSIPRQPNHMIFHQKLSDSFTPSQIQSFKNKESTLFLTGVLIYLDGNQEIKVPFCLYLIGGDGETVYCANHN